MTNNNPNWRFCVVGNIVEKHTDEEGNVFYGTKAFAGGAKVYIDDRTWDMNPGMVSVIGLNRYKRYAVESVPTKFIENIRAQKIYKPTILEIMDYLEYVEGWPWRGRTSADRKTVESFVDVWEQNRINSEEITL